MRKTMKERIEISNNEASSFINEKKQWFVQHKKAIIITATSFASTALAGIFTAVVLHNHNAEQVNADFATTKNNVSLPFQENISATEILNDCLSMETENNEPFFNEMDELESERPKRQYTHCNHPFSVSPHLRKLTGGKQASEDKILQGKELNLNLIEMGCTIVNGYTKGGSDNMDGFECLSFEEDRQVIVS